MEGFQRPKSGDTSNKDDRPKPARKATPHVPTNWWRTKTSSDFPLLTGMVMSCGFESYAMTREGVYIITDSQVLVSRIIGQVLWADSARRLKPDSWVARLSDRRRGRLGWLSGRRGLRQLRLRLARWALCGS